MDPPAGGLEDPADPSEREDSELEEDAGAGLGFDSVEEGDFSPDSLLRAFFLASDG